MSNIKNSEQERITLLLLPYWTPLIPPMGLACLKSFLTERGYVVKTFDANTEEVFQDIYHKYFNTLAGYIPIDKQGNFYNIGHNVLRNHLMAYQNYQQEQEYLELIRMLVLKAFDTDIDIGRTRELHQMIVQFYQRLEQYIITIIDAGKPSILGISAFSGSLAATVFSFQYVKKHFPEIKTLMGGGVFSDQLAVGSWNFEHFIRKTPFIDHFFVGEGELLLWNYLEGKLPEKKVYTLGDIGGETLDLSMARLPDFSDLNVQYYPQLAVYASRSCPFQCSFCSETVHWGRFRKKGAVQIADEMVELANIHKQQLFLMSDSLLNPLISELSEELIKRDLSLYWDGYLRADPAVCEEQNTLRWRRAGFYRARLGVESGSQKVLSLMGKKITPEQIKSAISSLAGAGIKTTTYWVIGYPGETEADFLETLNLIELLRESIYEAECNPFAYYPSGQVSSETFFKEHQRVLLYPEEANELLVTPTWVLDTSPSPGEVFDRMCRFVRHCKNLGIPNPYSMEEIYQADERWKDLHFNAVPNLLDFKKNHLSIQENKNIQKLELIENEPDSEDFCF